MSAVAFSAVVDMPPYYNINRIQCVYMWLNSIGRKGQTDVKRGIQSTESPTDFMAEYGLYAGDITAALSLGTCLLPPQGVIASGGLDSADGELQRMELFFKT